MKYLSKVNCYYIKADKWEEFKRLHLTRFRYEYDENKNYYIRRMRVAAIFIDTITRHIYRQDVFLGRKEILQSDIIKLLNRDMVEVITKEKTK